LTIGLFVSFNSVGKDGAIQPFRAKKRRRHVETGRADPRRRQKEPGMR
jgi:hypothetical protein